MSYLEQADIVASFRQAGVERGSVVMLHADAIVLAQLPPMANEARYAVLFDALEEILGSDGTLVMPTFTYSFTDGDDFDVGRTPSKVGALTEFFRTSPEVLRSRDPIFSVAARGRLAEAFATVPTHDCFGPQSAFGLLDQNDGILACFGCAFDRITFTHYVEQNAGVDYRSFKMFAGLSMENGEARRSDVRYFVRDLSRDTAIDLSRLRGRLTENGRLATVSVGRLSLAAVRARAFQEEALRLIEQQPNALIAEGSLGLADTDSAPENSASDHR